MKADAQVRCPLSDASRAPSPRSTELFTKESVRIVLAHDPKTPLFLYLACVPSPDPAHPPKPITNPPHGTYPYDGQCHGVWVGNPDATGASALI
eukprot:gene4486-17657_t